MRGSLILVGFLVFSLGLMLSLPSLVMSASSTGDSVDSKTEAVTFIVGNVIKDVKSAKDTSKTPFSILSAVPAFLMVVGIALIVLSFLLKF